MNLQKKQVRRFYEVVWNAHDTSAIAPLLDEDFTFRGSIGQEQRGHSGFAAYVDMIHHTLGDYRCTIEELVAEGDKVFAKMTFAGVHQNNFLGYEPSGKRLEWKGCALFRFQGVLISDVWVLGDLKALETQLEHNET